MKTHVYHNLKPKTDFSRTIGKNLLEDGIVYPVYEFVKSINKINGKLYQLKTYDEIINIPIHENKQYETIDEKL